jgi:hypothetical protein
MGRTKSETLIGEYLQMPLAATCRTQNPEAVKTKLAKKVQMLGLMTFKPQIEEARKAGIKAFDGAIIPEPSERDKVLNNMNLKTRTEKLMQLIINKKIESETLKERFVNNFRDMIIVSGEFGKVERDLNGNDTYRPIELKHAIYLESPMDPFLKRSPFMGEVRYMFKEDIFKQWPELANDKEKKTKILSVCNEPANYFTSKDQYKTLGNKNAIPVYFMEFKGLKSDIKEIRPSKNNETPYIVNRTEEEIAKESFQNDVKKGKTSVQVKYIQSIYEVVRIGNTDVYPVQREKTDVVQSLNGGSKYTAQYDYKGCLYGTVNGTRVSIQQLIDDLSNVYNIIRYQINKELSKIKGKVLAYNRKYIPKGENVRSLIYKMIEHSVIEYDTSVEGEEQNASLKDAISEFDLGASQSLPVLINLGNDIERVLDLVTGINKNRTGRTPASQTATGAQMDYQSSQSATYQLYFYHELYTSMVLKHLAEKTKLNWTWLKENSSGLLLDDSDENLLEIIKEFSFDDFDITITNGIKEQQIRERLGSYFGAEINAGMLRSLDVAAFEQSSTLSEGIAILEVAYKTIQDTAARQQQEAAAMQQQGSAQISQQQIELKDREREDMQQQERDLLQMKYDLELRNALQEQKQNSFVLDQEMLNDRAMQQEKLNHESEMGQEKLTVKD